MKKKQLEDYCAAEFQNMALVLNELSSVVRPGKEQYSVADIAAISTFIHNFYNGVENIIKRLLIAENVTVQSSPSWHKELLKTAAEKDIVSKEMHDTLSEYLAFRHFFIHAYAFIVEWEEMKALAEDVNNVFESFKFAVNDYINKKYSL